MPFKPPSVLIVDDHSDSSAMYVEALSMMGYVARAASTGDEALAQARALPPAAIVADVMLPGISGVDLTRRLRADTHTQEIAIIVLTGSTSPSIRQQAMAAGCDAFLLKPCLPDDLASEIHEVLTSRHSMKDGHARIT
jgi:two-component system cell cycle response regulator DivK